MPELPEVETVRRGLEKLVVGQRITAIDIRYPKIIIGSPAEFCQALHNKKLLSIGRRGKFLLFNFDQNLTMVSHLRMEGKYFIRRSDQPIEKHTHIIFQLASGQQLRYNDVRKFGRMQLAKTDQVQNLPNLSKLGPEPLSTDFKLTDFTRKLLHCKKAIKPALLDQTIVVGLGNIYVDEVLWLSQIHPLTSCYELTAKQAADLFQNIIQELTAAVKAGGTTVRTYSDAFEHSGKFQFALHVYGKEGQPCQRCGTKIQKIRVAQRGTHFCPQCQQAPV
ncbi:DNA-formamidopyrimidine glycosylase [Liquorilactobacillus vini]|uniref:Formamidopyrimidine-DNA glycosylase n=1 Tax=Liquorilactobacillus vini DSM 20605 TaxID=1133569 RepID=A0A0R2CDB3_9LACO|nr:DNA-formamidopyrimidine glycosylase [Liquorilactobacillus vini]KRM89774.1 formamidopyrimidine-DNA glycosylase [Liquorilactobacillus vini DSM 20605]